MFDGKAFGQEVVAAVKAHVDKSLAPIMARLDAIEAKMKEPAAVDEDDLAAVKSDVESLRKAIADLPAPVAPELPDIPALVAEAVAAIPAPEPSKSVTLDDVRPLVEEAAQKAVSALPAPKDGCGIKELLIDREGSLVATFDDGRMKNLGLVVGKDAEPVDMAAIERSIAEKVAAIPAPKNGKDGFSLKNFDATLLDDGRTVLLSFEDEEGAYKVELGFPVVLDRGVYKEDGVYSKGDGVTWGGSFWIAQVDSPEGKPDSGKGWRLAVKKGRDATPKVKH